MKKLSLTQRVFLITSVSVLPIVILILLNLLTLRAERLAEMHETALLTARGAATELERIISGVESVLITLAAAPVSLAGPPERCDEYYRRVTAALPHILEISLIDSAGYLVCSSVTNAPPIYLGDRSYYIEARKTREGAVGEYTVGRLTNQVGLPVAIPTELAAGIEGGVAVAMLDIAWLGNRMKERGLTKQGALTIADRNGRIITREPFPEDFVGTYIPDTYMQLVKATEPGSVKVLSQDGTERILGYLPANYDAVKGLYVSSGISTLEGYTLINQLTARGALIGLAGAAAAFLLTLSTCVIFIRRPFQRLIDTIEAWQRDETATRTGMGADLAEFGRAGQALDNFMDKLTAARAGRREAERQRGLLVRELDHRMKNLLATVQALARQTFRGTAQEGASRAFLGRLAAMGSAHQLLEGGSWQAAELHDLVIAAIAPFEDQKNPHFTSSGPPLDIEAKAAMALSMGLHELCTNAAKYGALRDPSGRVAISWDVSDEPAGAFTLLWQEVDGPPVVPPKNKGFGSTMIEQVMAMQIGGKVEMNYEPTGLRCRITAPLDRLRAERVEGSDPANTSVD